MRLRDILKDLLRPKSTIRKLFLLFSMLLVVAFSMLILVINEIKKKDITKSQLEIEKNRISQIDKELSYLYEKTYSNSEASVEKEEMLSQITFLKEQRVEAVKNIDDINSGPDSQLLIFTIMALVLTTFILIFFSNSFKFSNSQSDVPSSKRLKYDTIYRKKNIDFLNWILNSEIGKTSIASDQLYQASILKDIYDQSSKLGDDRDKLLRNVISYTHIKRNENEEKSDKFSNITIVFENIKNRIQDECNRLNKQAIINLFLCFFIAFILMTLIGYTSITSTNDNKLISLELFAVRYIPRIIGVIGLLTMFLYFTKLYKTNIVDVKYYQNELTNIEILQVTWQTASITDSDDILKELLSKLSQIDRNSIISKDQTSIEIERIKIENEISKDYLSKILSIFPKINSK
ncbi:hypothetical protein [Flavobacterium coralii]|uniref:hypothetical protein n=1 Tax=Flavobacterium coralii TaxID=2838017 RepID=UPI000C5DF8F2|nr:hypothetical protein [Flavobacterium sp.]